ncbi:MAG: hypothetical protein ACUVX9_17915 [Anaerolineae bacterium]
MSFDVWFAEDIRHILLAAERASDLSLAQAEEGSTDPNALRAFRRGYRAALTAVALACGLPLEDASERQPVRPR